jgi:uncharacterized protein (TIGR03437 family)
MNRQHSNQFFARVESLCRVTRLTFLLWALVGGIGAINSQAQTEVPPPNKAPTGQALPKKNNITPGYKIIEGDMQVPLNYSPESTFERNLWPGGFVHYDFDENVTPANREVARAAMRVWSNVANVAFRETATFDYIHIQDSDVNSSPVGRHPARQIVRINNWESLFIVVHELGHTLGLRHEQSRVDRDNFVKINGDNIADDKGDQFERRDGSSKYGPYDFDSVMHYGQCAFARNCDCDADKKCKNPTIKVNDPFAAEWQTKIGQRDHLSYLDGVAMSFLYPRGNFRFADSTNVFTQDGSFLQPYRGLSTAVNATPRGGTLWIQPGLYTEKLLLIKPMTLRAPLGGVNIRPREGPPPLAFPLASVSAASYNGELAAGSIAVAFGGNLAAGTAIAESLPLPTTLGGVMVKIRDAADTERDAPLFFVSPNQINYQVPTGTSVGIASVTVYNGGRVVGLGGVPITAAAPAFFSANANGEGAPAALLLRVRGDAQSYEPLARYDQEQQRFVPMPIDLGPEGDQLFLILFGTGFRAPGPSSAVSVTIGDEEAEVLFTGAAPGFAGLDQANVRLPRSLTGRGEVSIVLTADNRSSNAVTVSIR